MPAELRRAGPDDAAAITALTSAGFETYRAFLPPAWRPPRETREATLERLSRDGAWAILACDGDEVVGCGAFEPARMHLRGELIAGLAHVWAVFVAESHWGDGTATTLLAELTSAMAAQGFGEARLYTPAAHARARRFYAREGWTEQGPPTFAAELDLELVELRRRLPA